MIMNLKKVGLIIFITGIIVLFIIIWQSGRDEDSIPPASKAEIQHQTADEINVQIENLTLTTDQFFAEYRVEREQVRGRQIEMLREVLESSHLEKAQPEAAMQLVRIATDMEKEVQTEGMIKSKGFTDSVAIIQADNALIVIQTDRSIPEPDEEITEAVEKITGLDAEDICIIYRTK